MNAERREVVDEFRNKLILWSDKDKENLFARSKEIIQP
jgi:hypothetical protein